MTLRDNCSYKWWLSTE